MHSTPCALLASSRSKDVVSLDYDLLQSPEASFPPAPLYPCLTMNGENSNSLLHCCHDCNALLVPSASVSSPTMSQVYGIARCQISLPQSPCSPTDPSILPCSTPHTLGVHFLWRSPIRGHFVHCVADAITLSVTLDQDCCEPSVLPALPPSHSRPPTLSFYLFFTSGHTYPNYPSHDIITPENIETNACL